MCDWDWEASLCANLHKSRQFSFHVNANICKASRQEGDQTFSLPNDSQEEQERGTVTHEIILMIGDDWNHFSTLAIRRWENQRETLDWILRGWSVYKSFTKSAFLWIDGCTHLSSGLSDFDLQKKKPSQKNRNKICFAWNWWRAQWKHHWGKLASSSEAELGFISGPVYTSDQWPWPVLS